MKNTLMIDAIYRQRIRAVGWSVIAKFGLIPDNCIHWRVQLIPKSCEAVCQLRLAK